jgi:hypothetical protein
MSALSSYDLERTQITQEKLNLEELFEKKQEKDLKQLACFQKILTKIHQTIRNTSNHKYNQKHCWYRIPEIIIGLSCYQQSSCVAFVMNKLRENNFLVYFYYPNTLFISWHHIVPQYIRDEIKKKTQIEVDMFGNILPSESEDISNNNNNNNNNTTSLTYSEKKKKSAFRPIPPMYH